MNIDTLRDEVRDTIQRRALAQRGDHILVACSGGGDSVALLVLLSELRETLGILLTCASVDHGLRANAIDEVAHARMTAERLGVPFNALRLQLSRGASVQSRAREARYEALFACAKECGANLIATGHSLDDQAETVLSRLLRGSGLKGLGAIDPRRADGVIRPLIDSRRSALREFLTQAGVRWMDDPSNDDRAYERVRLRKECLLAMSAEEPNMPLALAKMADAARAIHARLNAAVALNDAQVCPEISLKTLQVMPPALQPSWFRAWLSRHAEVVPNGAQLRALARLVEAGRGEVLLKDGWICVADPSKSLVRLSKRDLIVGRGHAALRA